MPAYLNPLKGNETMASAPASNSSSSDFVRKLYKMLEDPNYREVVRWGDHGDSFVVLENEKFTKTILPKHFKHSNFASFVRQLNKYDFHKVRQNEENSGQAPYGASAWEFKHPEFRADAKNNLDNIRRKAPAPRKSQHAEDHFSSNTQVLALTETLAATQQQVQALQETYFEMAHANKVFVDEIIHLQKMVKAQHQVHAELIGHLSKGEQSRMSSRSANGASASPTTFNPSGSLMPDGSLDESLELRRAKEILGSISGEHIPERDLRQMSTQFQQIGASPESAGSAPIMGPPGSAGPNNDTYHLDPMNDLRHMVYPAGQTIGIDPFAAEHMGNIPYNRPVSQPEALGPTSETASTAIPAVNATAGLQGGSPWGAKKPRILLVEDDKTCSRIGAKFLAQYDCGVDVARDGLEAVNKVLQAPALYDLIFMDIVMPRLDGVSATATIREVAPRTPIIAMTSNINQHDLEMYFHWGMRDVLAKPFTKEGMIGKLKRYLTSFLRSPPPEAVMEQMYPSGTGQPPTPGPGPYTNPAALAMTSAPSGVVTKFESTPVQSPSTSSSWHSPNQISGQSPNVAQGDYLTASSASQLAMTPGGTQSQQYQPAMINMMAPGPRMPDGMPHADGPPEKRPRMYAPGTFAQ